MPELAEVEFFRKEWNPGLGHSVTAVVLHERSRLFRRCDPALIKKRLPGLRLAASEAHGKRLLFRFRKGGTASSLWLGIHLGMTGRLWSAPDNHRAEKHDHLIIFQKGRALVLSDTRQFGWVEFAIGEETPSWWRELPPAILSPAFTRNRVDQFLERHGRSPVKAVLLMQKGFPGLGNWMVDEILWRSGIAPSRPGGALSPVERQALFRAIRAVCRTSLETVGRDFSDPPSGWLFHQRWKKGGICPRTGNPLRYDRVAGRTSCWSPAVQR